MFYEETSFQSEVPAGKNRQGEYVRRRVRVTWYRASDGEVATPWTPIKYKRDERSGNSRPSAEKLWDRGSVFKLVKPYTEADYDAAIDRITTNEAAKMRAAREAARAAR